MPQPIAWRLEVTWDLLDGPPVDPAQTWESNTGDISTLGLTAGGVLRPWSSIVSPYLAAGLGAYWMQRVGGDSNTYGITYGAHAALGLDLVIDIPVRPFLELRGLFHATDYGSQEWSPTVYGTARAGLRFEW